MAKLDSQDTTDLSAVEIHDTLAYLAASHARFVREDIATDARWIAYGDTYGWDRMTDFAARSLCRTPAIVWG